MLPRNAKKLKIFICYTTLCKVCCLSSNVCNKLARTKMDRCEKIYVWNRQQEAFVSLTNNVLKILTEEERRNIQYKTIRVIVSHMMPYVKCDESFQHLGGYLGDIWNIVVEKFKFNYVVIPSSYEDGLEVIATGNADVMLAAVVFKKDLINVYYSHPYFYNWYHLYLKSPKGRPSSLLYLNIFSTQLWVLSFVMICLLTISVWFTSWFLYNTYHIERRVSLPNCFMGTISGFINQGFDLKLRSYSSRLQVMLALMFGVMLYYGMNAALVAKIALFESPYPFLSLPDIATRDTLSLCLRASSFVYNNFTDENKRILPEWRGILNNKHCLDINYPDNILKIICNENVIILENKVVMNSMSKSIRFPCTIKTHPDKYFRSGNSFLMSQSFREKKIIDKFIHHMRSTGVLQKLQEKWIENDITADCTKVSTSQITIEHTRSVFIFYIVAIFISLLILGLEILHDKYINPQRKNVTYYN